MTGMSDVGRRCAISGANGFVGAFLAEYFENRGWTVYRLSSTLSPASSQDKVLDYSLGTAIEPAAFEKNRINALINCAYDFRPVKNSDIHRINVLGGQMLLEAAREGGVETLIQISSITRF